MIQLVAQHIVFPMFYSSVFSPKLLGTCYFIKTFLIVSKCSVILSCVDEYHIHQHYTYFCFKVVLVFGELEGLLSVMAVWL